MLKNLKRTLISEGGQKMPEIDVSGYKPEEYDLIPDGSYECVVDKAEVKKGKTSGNTYISVELKIRSDVEQQCKGRKVFDVIAHDKENPSDFDHTKVSQIVATQIHEPGYTTKFGSWDEFVQFINKIRVLVKVNHKDAEGDYAAKNTVARGGYLESKSPLKTIGSPDKPIVENLDSADIDENKDLPF